MRFLLRWLLLFLLTVESHQENDSYSRGGKTSWRSKPLANHTLTLNAKVAKSGLQTRVPQQQQQPRKPIQHKCRFISKPFCPPEKPQQPTGPFHLPIHWVSSLSQGTQQRWVLSCLPKEHFCQLRPPQVSHQPGSPLQLPGYLHRWPHWPERPLYQLQRPRYQAKWPLYHLQKLYYQSKHPHRLPHSKGTVPGRHRRWW